MYCCELDLSSNTKTITNSKITMTKEIDSNLDLDDFVIIDKMETQLVSPFTLSHTFLFDANKYIDEILLSYSHDVTKILEQVYLDYCRTSIYCNNILIKTVSDFITHNNEFNSKIFGHNKDGVFKEYNFLTILLMLCCQSSYGLHYMSLNDIYCESAKGLLLCSSSDNRRTHFTIKDDVLSVTIETNLIIKDIMSNTVVKKINTKVIIDSYLDNTNKQGYHNFNEYGLFYWSIQS